MAMSITTPTVLDHPVLTALDAVVDAITPVNGPGAVDWFRFTDPERLTVMRRILQTRASVDALVAQAIGHLDRDGVVEREACVRTANWLRTTNHLSLGAARREVAAGRALTGRFTATATAFAAGQRCPRSRRRRSSAPSTDSHPSCPTTRWRPAKRRCSAMRPPWVPGNSKPCPAGSWR